MEKMSNITNVTLACDDDQQTGAHKFMKHDLIHLNMCNGMRVLIFLTHL